MLRRTGVSAWLQTVSAAFAVSLSALASPAKAQEDVGAAETAAARSLGVEGMKLAHAGQCEEAIVKLERAEKLRHSAIMLGKLGECYVTLGRLVEGTEILRKMLREPLPANPTPALTRAYERAQTALDTAKPRIAKVNVAVTAPPDADITLMVDGKSIASALIGSELPLDPGEHTIEASAPGFSKDSARVSLGAGAKESLTLKLGADPNTSKLAAAPALAPRSSSSSVPRDRGQSGSSSPSRVASEDERDSAPNRTAAYMSLGIGALGIGVGTFFGLSALDAKSDLEKDCGGTVCSSNEEARLSDAKREGTLSTIAFGVGAAGLAVGTILFFAAGSGSANASRRAPRLAIGIGDAHISTQF